MRSSVSTRPLALVTCLVVSVFIAGCGKGDHVHLPDGSHPEDGGGNETPKPHVHGPDCKHDEKADGHTHGSGKVIDLGAATVDGFAMKATRDDGAIVAGKDAPIDVVVTPPSGSKGPVAVRFWIGTRDAKGSVKARAAIEDPKEPTRWHTHAEIPNPLSTDAKLWVEVEAVGGAKSVESFDLKR